MRILVIPTTDWIRHPVPNRLNFIFDILSQRHEIYVLHFRLKRFSGNRPRETKCNLVSSGWLDVDDPSRYYLANAPSHLRTIKKTVQEKKIDLIVSANILPSFLATSAGVPVVFDYLDHLEESASVYYPDSLIGRLVKAVVGRIVRYNIVHSRCVITVTREFKALLSDIGALDVHVIANGVDTSLLHPMPKDECKARLGLNGPVLGYVGSLEHWVDLETVVQALPRIDAKLLVIGPGLFTGYRDRIKDIAAGLGVADRVIFLGAVEYSQLSPYISAMDIGLNPLKNMRKNQETVGGKVFNYLACGRPVLSSRMRSLEQLLGDELFYYDDVASFVSQAEQILGINGGEAHRRALAEQYDWRRIADMYEAVLENAMVR